MADVPNAILTEMAKELLSHTAKEPSNVPDAQQALTGYWAYLKRRGRTASTVKKYAQTLPNFLEWWGERQLAEVKPRDLEFWLIMWGERFENEHGREPSVAGQRSQVCALRGFFDYLERMEYITRNPCRMIESPKVTRRPIQHLTDEEDSALLSAVLSPQERILVPLLRYSAYAFPRR